MDAFDRIALDSPEVKPKFQRNNGKGDAFDQLPDMGQSAGEYVSRLAGSAATGYASGTPFGLLTNLSNLLAMGDVYDPEEMERIKAISEREGIPFDEEKYMEAAKQALGSFPTPANIARMAEEKTGLPITPKDEFQKLVEMGLTAGRAQPGAISQKAAAGVAAPATNATLQSVGVPEPFAELGGYAAGGFAGSKTPEIELKSTKPSGLTKRGFERLKEPTAVPEQKIQRINEKIEKDFREISDVIIKDSPIGETAENLANNVAFKQESRELLDEAQKIADSLPDTIPSQSLKKEIIDIGTKNVKGISLNEYDKSYMKFMKEALEDIIPENVSLGGLVETYRKNNRSLSEYFEPGASKALNRAKRDAILDQNRAIANLIEKSNPELSQVFKEGNSRWTKIMDTEAVDAFVSDVFKERINYKKLHDFFDKSGYDRIFKRALGEEGYKNFEKLIIDMLSSEKPYKMLRVAREKGYEDVARTLTGYLIHPHIGVAKAGMDALRTSYRFLMNTMLDKPQIGISFSKGMKEFKKANFAAAEKEFKAVEVELLAKEETPKAQPNVETVEVTPETIKTEPKELAKPEQKRLEPPKKQIEYKASEEKGKKTKAETKKKEITEEKIESVHEESMFREVAFEPNKPDGRSRQELELHKKIIDEKRKIQHMNNKIKLKSSVWSDDPDSSFQRFVRQRQPMKDKLNELEKEEKLLKSDKTLKSSGAWYLPGTKKPFAYSTQAISDSIHALIEKGDTFKDLYKKINYDPEAKAIIKKYIDKGYGDNIIQLYRGKISAQQNTKKTH